MKTTRILTIIIFLATSLNTKSQTLKEILEAIVTAADKNKVTLKDVSSTSFIVNSAANARLSNGKTRMAIKINLPPGTTSWFYRVTVLEKESTYSYQSNETLNYILNNNKNVDLYWPAKPYCVDLYLLGHSGDVDSFSQTGNDNFKCFTKHTKLNTGSTVGYITDLTQENLWIGIKNPNSTKGLKVIVEIVAQGKYN